ncbi:hypothetical protein [Streptomyces sp. NPDC087525]|uniref:hypothetical protein n=1 Tax=Streptomyces sp. NPDC087525 TaxID=3365793 RepID=UPI0037FF3686
MAEHEAAIEPADLVQAGLVSDAAENNGWSPEQITATPWRGRTLQAFGRGE